METTQVVNLDPSFAPFGYQDPLFERFSFPSGCEPHVKIKKIYAKKVVITFRIKSSEDLIFLLLATDAIKRQGISDISLFLPFLPFSRQDRVMVSGEPLSVKVVSDLINLQGYSKVTIYDPHSDVSLALINNSFAVNNHKFVSQVLRYKSGYLIVSPDAGAYKKIFKLCEELKYKDEIVLCNKVRDVSNGSIKSVSCNIHDFQGMDLYIVDDICDGGGTFIMLADELKKRNCGKVNLIVSHGIFSKGVDALTNINQIYTTNSFSDLDSNNRLTQIKLCNTLI